jgi:hypothetical protein
LRDQAHGKRYGRKFMRVDAWRLAVAPLMVNPHVSTRDRFAGTHRSRQRRRREVTGSRISLRAQPRCRRLRRSALARCKRFEAGRASTYGTEHLLTVRIPVSAPHRVRVGLHGFTRQVRARPGGGRAVRFRIPDPWRSWRPASVDLGWPAARPAWVLLVHGNHVVGLDRRPEAVGRGAT